jgi:hypothetical protein
MRIRSATPCIIGAMDEEEALSTKHKHAIDIVDSSQFSCRRTKKSIDRSLIKTQARHRHHRFIAVFLLTNEEIDRW